MPAVSKSQRHLFGMVDAYKHHNLHHAQNIERIKSMAADMSINTIQHYSKTKEKGLPKKKHHEKTAGRGDMAKSFFSRILTNVKAKQMAASQWGKYHQFSGGKSLLGDIEAGQNITKSIPGQAPAMARGGTLPNMVANTMRAARPIAKMSNDKFAEGFVKRAQQYGVKNEDMATYIKLAGLDKEAFLPALLGLGIRGLGMIGGSALGASMGENLAARAATTGFGAADKYVPGFARNALAKMAPTATKAYKPGDVFDQEKTFMQQLPGNIGMMAGGAIGEPVSGLVASPIENMEQQKNYLPPEQYPQYNQ